MDKLLLIEDDRNISEMICEYLSGKGFCVQSVFDGREAVSAFRQDGYALVLLDLMLPGCSGLEVLSALRKVSAVPIILVTAKDNDRDKTMGLNLGADDYVTKPFSPVELAARIRANIRRATNYNASSGKTAVVAAGEIRIDLEKHQASRKGVGLQLTHTEFEILRLLASHPGTAFSKERLYNQIWKEPYFGNESVLNAHMNRLRKKLKAADPQGKEVIRTLWGIGYKIEED